MLLQTNTFQTVLATNGRMSFVLFHYGNLTWTTGTLSGGSPTTGRGGNPAAVSMLFFKRVFTAQRLNSDGSLSGELGEQ